MAYRLIPILCRLLAIPNLAVAEPKLDDDAGAVEKDRRGILLEPSANKEFLMRFLVLLIVTIGAVVVVVPSQAQTYDPNYPICLQIYDDMVHYYFECSYTSMAQCQASASGRNAQCVVNPYFAKPSAKRAPHQKRHTR